MFSNNHCSNDESRGSNYHTNTYNAKNNTNNDRCGIRHAGLTSSAYKQRMHTILIFVALCVGVSKAPTDIMNAGNY